MDLRVKRLYASKSPSDGTRILVDRLWPRGFAKGSDAFDLWLRDLAPSDGLRTWFGHEPARWEEFKRRYFEELATRSVPVQTVIEHAKRGTVTLVYSSRDEVHNQAVALREFILNAGA
jgi:uncharacterized protein YeaO (DUF488 family)